MPFSARPQFFRLALLGTFALATFSAQAQTSPARGWQHLDQQTDGVPGISAGRAYRELLNNHKPTRVLGAVIDSGIDSTHEDLKQLFWHKPGEVAGNGVDDDHNGYVDDSRGWNCLGGKNGRNIEIEALEQPRLYAQYRPQFEGKKR